MPDQDPYAVPPDVADGAAEPHPELGSAPAYPPYGTSAGMSGGPSPQERAAALRRTRVTLVIAMVALPLSVIAAPVGLALGVFAVARIVKDRPAVRRARLGAAAEVIPLVTAVAAMVIGLVMTALIAFFAAEVLDYRACLDGANTVIAEDKCEQAFLDSLRDRWPG